jgi:hypothetical protein
MTNTSFEYWMWDRDGSTYDKFSYKPKKPFTAEDMEDAYWWGSAHGNEEMQLENGALRELIAANFRVNPPTDDQIKKWNEDLEAKIKRLREKNSNSAATFKSAI